MSHPRLTRTRLLQAAIGGAAAFGLVPGGKAVAAKLRAPHLFRIAVRNPGRSYLGDRRLFATVSPSVPGRDAARIAFQLDRPGKVKLEALRTALRNIGTVWQVEYEFPARHARCWSGSPTPRCRPAPT